MNKDEAHLIQPDARGSNFATGVPWRLVAWIEFWLFLFPPWGLWLLWKDSTLTKETKGRVLVYTFLIPVLGVIAASLYSFHVAQHMLDQMGAVG